MTLDQARTAVLATLDSAGVTAVEVAGALEPNGAGRLVVLVDDASTTVDRLVGATRRRSLR